MKPVIFICLLSISTCLSRPDDSQANAPSATTLKGPVTPTILTPTQSAPSSDPTTAKVATPTGTSVQPQNAASPPVTPPPKEEAHDHENPKISTTTEKAKTDNESPDSKAKTGTVPPVTEKGNKSEPTTPKPEPTTLKPEPSTMSTVKPSEAPKATDIPPLQARGFDGPSFIGGIILTLGLLAIGFMGFKYYKNQTERNYHTL